MRFSLPFKNIEDFYKYLIMIENKMFKNGEEFEKIYRICR